MPRRTRRRTGRGAPTYLTPERASRILDLIADGNHVTTACAAAGITRATYYQWLAKGEDAAAEAEATGQPVPDAKRVYVDFVDRVARARAKAEVRAVDVVRRSMTGGFVISERPVVDGEGNPVRGEGGEVLWERTFAQPDGRLALEYLARSRPEQWGRSQPARVEVTGADGGPVAVEQSVVIASLAERVAQLAAERRAELAASEPDASGVYAITGGAGGSAGDAGDDDGDQD